MYRNGKNLSYCALAIVYVPTEDMTSNYFTKPLQGAVFSKLMVKIMSSSGFISLSS